MEITHFGRPALKVPVEDPSQVGQVRREATRLAQDLGFDENARGRVALAATELGTNLLKHAGRGECFISLVPGRNGMGLELATLDAGPGFNLHQCLTDGFSTRGTQGIGLGGVARQAQLLDAWSDAKGAVVVARVYRRASADEDLRIGASQLPLATEEVCGDGWALAVRGDQVAVALIDGLGHGALAHDAASRGLQAFLERPLDDPLRLIEHLGSAMAGTRGGAVALARSDPPRRMLGFLGVGNIVGSLVDDAGSRGLASMPGIVGGQFRKPLVFAGDTHQKTLVLHSDGLSARWTLRDYPGLLRRHPAVLAWTLKRDQTRGRDDATVIVIDLERFR